MYHIQYETVFGTHELQEIDTRKRHVVVAHLARYEHPIVAVYEQTTTVTKAMREELRKWPGSLSQYARDFMSQPPR